jgi:hypothetical protein
VPLLFEAVADDGSGCRLSMLETAAGAVQRRLVEGNLLVQARDHWSDVGIRAFLSVNFPGKTAQSGQ